MPVVVASLLYSTRQFLAWSTFPLLISTTRLARGPCGISAYILVHQYDIYAAFSKQPRQNCSSSNYALVLVITCMDTLYISHSHHHLFYSSLTSIVPTLIARKAIFDVHLSVSIHAQQLARDVLGVQ
ncbi:hypothetical protein EJ05DRAFT_388467 [Pseudovirgaria hyperparasitica]|uniref:Uncharacterized protein n=1 Tax=Pseudovirgaria hyperparasitica TaxID=470096 RepID=A0A6A6W368_9PEZI|nr:uncharacterized protein EJ05DRAFT_388467 [Pseudovirgaria hyperparasitica]KAF2757388.1 hypothetical protein EJ05DRAFT_388467 [Pseudovirgaria hyperparasitica]